MTFNHKLCQVPH